MLWYDGMTTRCSSSGEGRPLDVVVGLALKATSCGCHDFGGTHDSSVT